MIRLRLCVFWQEHYKNTPVSFSRCHYPGVMILICLIAADVYLDQLFKLVSDQLGKINGF